MKTSLFIGRFQPFHLGHLSVIEKALQDNDFLVIGIGSAEDSYLPDNPFTASERWKMITATLDDADIPRDKYTIIPVRNINNYSLWVDHVSRLVPPFERVYTGSTIVRTLFQDHGKYEVIDVEFIEKARGVEVRKKMATGGDWEELVPKTVADYLVKINGAERMREIS